VVPDPDAQLPPVPEPADPGLLAGYASLHEALTAERAGLQQQRAQLQAERNDVWSRGQQAAA
jgi:hypothetical protein